MSRPRPEAPPRVSAIVVAAGRGERFGAADKVLRPLAGRPLLLHALAAIDAATTVQDVVLVVGEHTRAAIERLLAAGVCRKPVRVVVGGERRQDSVALGLRATAPEVEVVVVHDAGRPLVSAALVDRCVAASLERGAAIAAVPVTDTIKRVAAGLVQETVPRDDLWAAQTPQAFRRSLLRDAFASPLAGTTFTDEAGLFEALGLPVAIVPGDRHNLKVTQPEDLAIAEALLAVAP
jgi:2-C-methyl-D-erythritol 4-phosphate cytidylyltransferase